MSQNRYDLVVIGSGPAGQKAALNAAKLGKRVALIDGQDLVGGVCIHTGTIPSKAIREAVLHLTGFKEREVYGHSYAVKRHITMADLLYRAQHVVRTEVDVIRNQMFRNGITLLFGSASFVDANTVRISRPKNESELDPGRVNAADDESACNSNGDNDAFDIHAQYILIASGTEPARPKQVPFALGRVFDSNELLLLRELPKSILIVGGGVIGTEYACMLAAVGVKVTLVESRPRLLEFLDDEIAENLQFRLRDMGVRLRLGEMVSEIELMNDNTVEATLQSRKRLRAQCLLYTIGRQGATSRLNLGDAGIAADERGRLKVNEFYQTTVPHIYAAGDVIGFPALAATSMEQGRLASCHMFKQFSEPPAPLFPIGIYTIPEISMVGATEQALTQQQVPYEVGIARYREIARGQLIADPHGLLKLLFHQESRRLLGVHAIGTGATELIHIGQAVMSSQMPIDYFVETVFNYPTLAECYKVAALDGINRVRSAGSTTIHAPAQAA